LGGGRHQSEKELCGHRGKGFYFILKVKGEKPKGRETEILLSGRGGLRGGGKNKQVWLLLMGGEFRERKGELLSFATRKDSKKAWAGGGKKNIGIQGSLSSCSRRIEIRGRARRGVPKKREKSREGERKWDFIPHPVIKRGKKRQNPPTKKSKRGKGGATYGRRALRADGP